MRAVILALGESDCEDVGDGWLAQPVNALSSLLFSVVGVAIWVWATRVEGRERTFRLVFGATLVATGIGSFLFHGPQSAGSHFLHDITFLAALLTVGIGNIGAGLGWTERSTWMVTAAAVLAAGVVLLIVPEATNVLMVASMVVIAAGEVVIHRSGGGDGRWYAITAVLVVIGLAFFLLGRTGSVVCEPDSPYQAHAAWHAVIGAALGAYAVATAPARLRAQTT